MVSMRIRDGDLWLQEFCLVSLTTLVVLLNQQRHRLSTKILLFIISILFVSVFQKVTI